MNITDQHYIGIFDSGVGGLTVLHQAMESLPHEHYIYYADSANVPYGNKRPEQVLQLVESSIDHLMKYPLKAVLLACNTATSIAASVLRTKMNIPVIGMEPAVKPAILHADPRRILVMATDLTLKEKKYNDLVSSLDTKDRVDTLSMQDLVDFAEEYDFESSRLKKYLKKKLSKINWDHYHSIVLGCTHFIYFKPLLLKMLPDHIHVIDGNEGTVKNMANLIDKNPFGTESELLCLLSGMEVSSEVIGPYLNYLRGEHFRFFTPLS